MNKHKELLTKYLPPKTIEDVFQFIVSKKIAFQIKKGRKKLKGSYCPSQKSSALHVVTINNDLNPYEFVWVCMHEFAHLQVYEKYGRKTLPHGVEWKQEFRLLMLPYLDRNIFPLDLASVLKIHLQNPSATSNKDANLVRAFRKYDSQPEYEENGVELASLSLGTRFLFQEKPFLLLQKRRTRYLCKSLHNERNYLVSGSAFVRLLS